MTFLIKLQSLLKALVVLLLCCLTNTAPTHHLTIGVQGNTPTLIVTSSEIGITPETMGLTKQPHKKNYVDKTTNRDLKISEFKDTIKTKLNKNRFLNDKKEKNLEKLSNKFLKFNEKSEKIEKTLSQKLDQESFPMQGEDLKTTTTATLLNKTINTTTLEMPKAVEKLPKNITQRPLKLELIQNKADTLHLSPTTTATTSSSQKIYSATTTINYKDANKTKQVNIQANEKVFNKINNEVANKTLLQSRQISAEINDTNITQTPAVTTEIENLLLANIETKAFSLTSSTPATHLSSSVETKDNLMASNNTNAVVTTTEQILPLSSLATMTTTEIIAGDDSNIKSFNDNESEQSKTKTTEMTASSLSIENVKQITQKDRIAANTQIENQASTGSQDILNPISATSTISTRIESSSKLEPKNVLTVTTSTLRDSSSLATEVKNLQPTSTLETTLNPAVEISTESSSKESLTESLVTKEKLIKLKISPTISNSKTSNSSLQTDASVLTTIPTLETSSESIPTATTTTTTEKILELIDLEQQHVVKSIDDLKQSSLLAAEQHDNGHDGLKNIKKKQLVDKHYVEALLHNKQDNHKKDVEVSGISAITTTKPALIPIKHGYLGPILMEEKTFHVIHHHSDNAQEPKVEHKTDLEAQLRQGHFVELKVKTEVTASTVGSTSPPEISAATATATSFAEKSAVNESETETPFNVFKNNSSLVFHTTKSTISPTSSFMSQVDKKKISPLETSLLNFKANKTSTKDLSSKLSTTESSPVTTKQKTLPEKQAAVLSTTVFQVADTMATKVPMVQANTMFTSENKEGSQQIPSKDKQTESKISDIQIEVYDSTIDSIIASTNFKDSEQNIQEESHLGKTTKPPIAAVQQERFTQYVIDRTETSTQESINYSTIQVASGKPEPAAIEIHINVSESFGNENEDLDFSYPQAEFNDNNEKLALTDESYDDNKVNENIKLKIPSNGNSNNKDSVNDEILVVEIIDADNMTADTSLAGKPKTVDEIFITDVKDQYTTPPPPPPPPPYRTNFDRDSDTIFYISNTEVKVGESLPNARKSNEERKLKLESQFFPANYMASTHPNINTPEEAQPAPAPHHLYEEDIILSSSHNQQDSLKIYRNRNEPSPPLDVTYVGESIIEVEQSPDTLITTTYTPEQHQTAIATATATPQADVIIQPAILPEISIGVPVIGELPPQIELKEIDFMPNEAQLHRSGMYDDNDNDIDDNNNHDDVDSNNNNNNNLHVDESSIQYGGDLIDESADGGFDGVEGSYPFGNPAIATKSYTNSYLAKLRKQQQQQKQQKQQQQPNHIADYTHLYVNYGVNNMRKDELSADIKDSSEMFSITGGSSAGADAVAGTGVGGTSNELNLTNFKDFLNKVSLSNNTQAYLNANTTQSERMSNATAFSVMEDANDLEDKNTEDIINLISLAIGLFIVILPVVVTCSMFWALRYLYKKYHSNINDNGGYTDQTETKVPLNEDGMEKGEFVHETFSSPTHNDKDAIEKYPDTSNKPYATKTTSTTANTDSIHKFSTEIPCHLNEISTGTATTTATNTTFTTTTGTISKTNDCKRLTLDLTSPTPCPCPPKQKATVAATEHNIHTVSGDDDNDVELPGPNGSITKMTMENNLLIVETEESNDISRVARETKMDYNKDGVFVVEVARGIDSKTIPESPVTDGGEKMLSMFNTKENNGGVGSYKMANEKNFVNNEKVQIHSPPQDNTEDGPRSLHQIQEVDEPINSPHLNDNKANDGDGDGLAYKCNTGLSQSDLSSASSNDSNKDYCYGNQALYVVEQSGYSTTTPTDNVVLKCDVKDIKDDDRNPGNDHYLKHSPNRKEEGKDKEHELEKTETTKEGGSRTNSGESPAQKPNDKGQNIKEMIKNESHTPEVKENEKDLNKTVAKTQIPVKIEVHVCADIAKEQDDVDDCASNSKVDTETYVQPKTHTELNTDVVTKDEADVVNKTKLTEAESVVAKEKVATDSLPLDLEEPNQASLAIEKKMIVNEIEHDIIIPDKLQVTESDENNEKNSSENMPVLSVAESFSNYNENTEEPKSLKATEENTNSSENCDDFNVDFKNSDINKNDTEIILNGLVTSNGLSDKERAENNESLIETKIENKSDILVHENGFKEMQESSSSLTNGSTILPDLVSESITESLQNGHSDILEEAEIQNGYDSLLSLPVPPPTTEELQLNSDLSDQQMDSLPPPPPPEIFSLKDLPPPSATLTNGCDADSPQSEESTNSFYNTLPPPPPTTLTVTATATGATTAPTINGKLHASPLTPPASPPAHFTSNLHAGLCSQPIAVDVNGS